MNSLGGYVSASLSAVQHSFLSGGADQCTLLLHSLITPALSFVMQI